MGCLLCWNILRLLPIGARRKRRANDDVWHHRQLAAGLPLLLLSNVLQWFVDGLGHLGGTMPPPPSCPSPASFSPSPQSSSMPTMRAIPPPPRQSWGGGLGRAATAVPPSPAVHHRGGQLGEPMRSPPLAPRGGRGVLAAPSQCTQGCQPIFFDLLLSFARANASLLIIVGSHQTP
jgi:hypothetical protein